MKTVVLVVLFYAVAASFISTVVHEFGHVLAGLMNGWKFLMMVIGPFKLYRDDPDGKILFGIEKNPALWGGCGGTMPKRIDDSVTEVFARILIAGPLASLVLGTAGMAAFFLTKHEFLLMLGMVSLGQGLVCILPMKIKTGILYNDGTRFLRIRRKGKEAEEEKVLIESIFAEVIGDAETKKAREDHLIEVLLDSDDASYRYYGFYYAYMRAKEDGNEAEMERVKAGAEKNRDGVSRYVLDSCDMS